jgi:hypothetical protein
MITFIDISDMEEWTKVTAAEVRSFGGRGLLDTYGSFSKGMHCTISWQILLEIVYISCNISSALRTIYPQHNWKRNGDIKPENEKPKIISSTKILWPNLQYQKKFLNELSKELNIL